MSVDLDRPWFTTEQAAEYAQCHYHTVSAALRSGELHGSQRGGFKGRWRIRREDIDEWLQRSP